MPAHVDPQHAEAALQQRRHLLGPAAAVRGQRMGDADGRRVLRADQIVGDAASRQRQQHGAFSLNGARRTALAGAYGSLGALSCTRQRCERHPDALGEGGRVAGDVHALVAAPGAGDDRKVATRADPMPSREAAAAPRWRGRPRAARRPTPSGPTSRPRDAQPLRSDRPARAGSAAPRSARRPVPPRAAARRKFQKKAGARSYRISRRRNISSRIRITGEISTPPKFGRNERIGRSSGSVIR